MKIKNLFQKTICSLITIIYVQKIKQEDTFKKRLEKHQTKSAYEVALSLINNQIEKLASAIRNDVVLKMYRVSYDI